MKKLLTILLIILTSAAFSYLMGVFYLYEWNPYNWLSRERNTTVWIFFICLLAALVWWKEVVKGEIKRHLNHADYNYDQLSIMYHSLLSSNEDLLTQLDAAQKRYEELTMQCDEWMYLAKSYQNDTKEYEKELDKYKSPAKKKPTRKAKA